MADLLDVFQHLLSTLCQQGAELSLGEGVPTPDHVPDLVELGREMAEHYVCPLGRTLKAVTPEAVRRQSGFKTVRYARLIRTIDEILADATRIGAKQQALLDGLAESGGPVAVDRLLARAGASSATLRGLAKKGWVELTERKELRDAACFDVPITEPAFDLNEEQCEALERINRKIDGIRDRHTKDKSFSIIR